MAVELNLTDEASQDVNEAYNWYETAGLVWGRSFLAALKHAQTRSAVRRKHTQKYTVIFDVGLGCRFPFAVFYEYTDGKVTVYRVFLATSQDPEKWRRSLK